eukprot:2315292-Rhodomonas_salina.1
MLVSLWVCLPVCPHVEAAQRQMPRCCSRRQMVKHVTKMVKHVTKMVKHVTKMVKHVMQKRGVGGGSCGSRPLRAAREGAARLGDRLTG